MKRALVDGKAPDITSFFKKVKLERNLTTGPVARVDLKKEIDKRVGGESDVLKSDGTVKIEKPGVNGTIEKGSGLKSVDTVRSDFKTADSNVISSHMKNSANAQLDTKFNKEAWIKSLKEDQLQLLDLEITTLHDSWLLLLHKELTKPYFLELKRFVKQEQNTNTIFPPSRDIYSWSRLTPLEQTRVLVIGQDPYHNFNQAHGLAFSVKDPNTKIPPSLQNIYKTIQIEYPEFKIPKKNANLTPWAESGVLMLNTCLTVRAHQANSHSGKGWEQFTKQVVTQLIKHHRERGSKLCIMCWGGPAQKLIRDTLPSSVEQSSKESLMVLRSCHPSPLSAHRGDFFHCGHFSKCNEWLGEREAISWSAIAD